MPSLDHYQISPIRGKERHKPISPLGTISLKMARIFRLSRRYGSRLTYISSDHNPDRTSTVSRTDFMSRRIHLPPIPSFALSVPVSSDVLDVELRTHSLRLIYRVEPVVTSATRSACPLKPIASTYRLIPNFLAG